MSLISKINNFWFIQGDSKPWNKIHTLFSFKFSKKITFLTTRYGISNSTLCIWLYLLKENLFLILEINKTFVYTVWSKFPKHMKVSLKGYLKFYWSMCYCVFFWERHIKTVINFILYFYLVLWLHLLKESVSLISKINNFWLYRVIQRHGIKYIRVLVLCSQKNETF